MAYSPFTTPRNTGNSYSASLITPALLEGAITQLQHRCAPLAAFSRQFQSDPLKPKCVHYAKLITAGATAQTNATNFESGDSTVTHVEINLAHISQSWHTTTGELNSGMRLSDIDTVNIQTFANKLWQVVAALFSTSAFSSQLIAPGAFGWSDMGTLRGLLKKSPIKNAILDGEYFAQLTNTPAYYQRTDTKPGAGYATFGWDGVHESSDWTTAGTAGVRGIVCNPQAIAVIASPPLAPAGAPQTLEWQDMVLPGLEMTVRLHSWLSLATRTLWRSLDVVFGAAVADSTAAILIRDS
jgi:hypothetical protein